MLNNFLYIILLAIGFLFVANGKAIDIGITSRIMSSSAGLSVSSDIQRITGLIMLVYSIYNIFAKK